MVHHLETKQTDFSIMSAMKGVGKQSAVLARKEIFTINNDTDIPKKQQNTSTIRRIGNYWGSAKIMTHFSKICHAVNTRSSAMNQSSVDVSFISI